MKKHILIFSPHPDDEAIACGGTIARLVSEGHDVRVIFVTDGSHSHLAVLGIATNPSPTELTFIRQQEAQKSVHALGVAPGNVIFIGIEDTQLHASQPHALEAIKAILRSQQTIDEIYMPHEKLEMHSDHRYTGELIVTALAQLALQPTLYKYVVWDAQTETDFDFQNRADLQQEHNTHEEKLRFDVTPYLVQKIAAFRQHKTQAELFSPQQSKPVVPIEFQHRRVEQANIEEFWLHQY
ncbi:PIG-L family deacetylase [Marinomonas agarivorans]|nr:PIG-L family deacetylase [Marinomonas agarivorans]